MASLFDFAGENECISFAEIVSLLQLELKYTGNQWRGACPACNSGTGHTLPVRTLVITNGKGWYCFAHQKGGRQIELAAHILDLGIREAAAKLAQRAGIAHRASSKAPER